ncbi:MAG: molecular chaperone HtpG [Alphaproteobacteria bacterium]|nr:molecular chaperone HtpG [Alphaproteobacteria bacterium]
MADAKAKPKKKPAKSTAKAETLSFQAEMSRLLDIVAHSLYSDKEVFLRELISNASDACDRLRHDALTAPELAAGDGDYRIAITVDEAAKTLTVADNGIGMNRDDLVDNLGTIARSGTSAFVESLTGDARKDTSLIGQFGVGFYSAFMVADSVEVVTRRAGEGESWRWSSDGKGSFTIEPAEREGRGTTITVHMRDDDKGYLNKDRLSGIVKRYSDHIPFPITLAEAGGEPEQANTGAALWTRPKSEVTADQYKEFYHHVAHMADDPWSVLHFHAEGVIDYRALLFVPSMQPFDLFQQDRESRVKLYVKRVFITDHETGLVPPWLRFLRGIVDSEDLPLNVSREMLQDNPVTAKIRGGIVKRTLDDLEKKAKDDSAAFDGFWKNFGAVLKEGIYEGAGERDRLVKLCRFRSTASDGLVSLADYVGRMREGQDEIYYISGDNAETLAKSPQLEGFRAKGIEVLLMTDPVDDFWVPMVGVYEEKAFKSVTRGGADLSKVKGKEKDAPEDKADESELGPLIAAVKLALGEKVKDVQASHRLTDSAVCLVAGEQDMDIHMERILRAHKQLNEASARILEINPKHALIKGLAERAKADASAPVLEDAAWLLLDQARILEGEPVTDPVEFARRLSKVMAAGLG